MELILACIAQYHSVTLWNLWPNVVISLNLYLPHALESRLVWDCDELGRIRYALKAISHHTLISINNSMDLSHLLWGYLVLLLCCCHASSVRVLGHSKNITWKCLWNVHGGFSRNSTVNASLVLDWGHFVTMGLVAPHVCSCLTRSHIRPLSASSP